MIDFGALLGSAMQAAGALYGARMIARALAARIASVESRTEALEQRADKCEAHHAAHETRLETLEHGVVLK